MAPYAVPFYTRSMLLTLAVLTAACDGCRQPTTAPSGDRPIARDGAVAQRGDAATAPSADDPCSILQSQQRDLVVARVGDQTLTLCDFTRRINSNNPYLRARFNSPEQRRALLQSWIDAELLAAEAHARGFDDEPEVRRAVTMQLARRLEMNVRDGVAQPEVTEAEVQAYYEAHRSEYDTEAQVRVSQIVLRDRARAEATLAELRAHPDDDTLFRLKVRTLSTDLATRAADGDTGFFGIAGSTAVPREVATAAFTLTTNGALLDHVVEAGGDGAPRTFTIVRLTARRDAMHRTLAEESRRIRGRLMREKRDQAEEAAMRALIEQLRRAATVHIDEAALSRVVVTPGDGSPPALHGPLPPGVTIQRANGTVERRSP